MGPGWFGSQNGCFKEGLNMESMHSAEYKHTIQKGTYKIENRLPVI